jgi:myo-inositol-1(or 4)-monophosphatase
MNPIDLLEAAEAIAREAGGLLRTFVGEALDVRLKGDVDLVTRADRASESLILSAIRERFPEHEILAEESGGVGALRRGQTLWVVDPLDGTTNFAHGVPIWSVSIGVLKDGEPIAGVVYDPSREECFTAARGQGAFLNGRRIRVSPCAELGRALLVTGFPYDIRTSPVNNLDHFARFMLRSRAVRRLGSAALDLAWVAAGRFDAFWELKLHPWDLAAGLLLVTEAGGEACRFDGSALDIFTDEVVAGPAGLLPAIRAVLAEGRRPAETG